MSYALNVAWFLALEELKISEGLKDFRLSLVIEFEDLGHPLSRTQCPAGGSYRHLPVAGGNADVTPSISDT